ncbi:MAG: SgcJ/EcaC family oxidoreductase [Acidobacteriota bacterium]
MLRRLLLISLLAAGALPVVPMHAQNPDPLFTATREQLAVAKTILAQETAWNKGDLDGFLKFFKDAPDTEVMLGNPVYGLTDIRNAFHTLYPAADAMGKLEDSEIQVRSLGDNFALATGKYHISRSHKAGGDAQGTFSEILEKTPTGWQVIFSESI